MALGKFLGEVCAIFKRFKSSQQSPGSCRGGSKRVPFFNRATSVIRQQVYLQAASGSKRGCASLVRRRPFRPLPVRLGMGRSLALALFFFLGGIWSNGNQVTRVYTCKVTGESNQCVRCRISACQSSVFTECMRQLTPESTSCTYLQIKIMFTPRGSSRKGFFLIFESRAGNVLDDVRTVFTRV